MEYSRISSELVDFAELKGRYAFRLAKEEWFDPIISEMEGQLIVSRTFGNLAARVRPQGYGYIYRELLRELKADQLEIDWPKQEILSDSADFDWFPFPAGWKWLSFEADAETARGNSVASIDSRKWTGFPANFQLTPDKQKALAKELDLAELALANPEITQELQAQGRAYIIAIRALADAPDPPTDLIWEMVNRANSLAGIASLFVSILGLFL